MTGLAVEDMAAALYGLIISQLRRVIVILFKLVEEHVGVIVHSPAAALAGRV